MQMTLTPATPTPLQTIFDSNRAGDLRGVYSVCCAHPQVIRAALELARDRAQMAVIESTCNQVNQNGGYTGMSPAQFADEVRARSRVRSDFPKTGSCSVAITLARSRGVRFRRGKRWPGRSQ